MMRSLTTTALLTLALCLCACSSWDHPGGNLTVTSYDFNKALTPAIATSVYKRVDANTADLYFSDLPEDRLTDPTDPLADSSGVILHIHFFLEPDAGNTPIDDTACNVTIRQIVLVATSAPDAPPIFGVYGGGGFFFPDGSPGSTVFGGSIRDGTHRLIASTPSFHDALGPASISGKLLATRDDDAADLIQRKMRQLIRQLPKPLEETTPAPSKADQPQ